MDAGLQNLANCLLTVQSNDNATRMKAEEALASGAKQAGYPLALMQLVSSEEAGPTIRLAAALHLKRFVENFWVPQEGVNNVAPSDRQVIKQQIVALTVSLPSRFQDILAECVGLIAKTDYPVSWDSLPKELVAALDTSNFGQIIGALKLAHSLFKRYRGQYETEGLVRELLYSLEVFAEPFLALFTKVSSAVAGISDKATLELLFEALFIMSKIFYSLNCQDLPAHFQDNMASWMTQFGYFLKYENPLLESSSPDETSILTKFQASICDNVALYTEVAEEEFAPYLPAFTGTIWERLMKTTTETKDDVLVSTAIKFLTNVSNIEVHAQMFSKPETLQAICEKIIIPNIGFRPSDQYLFDYDPVEYIRNDIEGADQQTRRRAACDLITGLCRHFNEPVTVIFTNYVGSLLQQFAANPTANWAAKDAATYLVVALAIKSQSERFGTSAVNDFINVVDYFGNQILPDLQASATVNPVLVADALKFVTTFRNQLPREALVLVLPLLVPLLGSSSLVIQSYAAYCVDRLLVVNSQGTRVLVKQDLAECLQGYLTNMFGVLENGRDSEVAENKYLMKAIMRVAAVSEEVMANYVDICLAKLIFIVERSCSNPGDPHFNHFVFETISVLIRNLCTFNPQLIETFEKALFPPFQKILANEIGDFLPYVFQILSQLLEKRSMPIPAPYTSLLQPLMTPFLWEQAGSIPAMVRLLIAFLVKASDHIVSAGLLEPLLGVFQKLASSLAHDKMGFELLGAVIEYIPAQHVMPHLPTILTISFSRLASTKTFQLESSIIVFSSLMMGLHGPDTFIQACESIQPGIFGQFLGNVFLQNVCAVDSLIERKICAIGMIKLLTESPSFASNFPGGWPHVLGALVKLFEAPRDDTPESGPIQVGGEQYDTKYCKLAYAEGTEHDPFAAIVDPKVFLAQSLVTASTANRGVYPALISKSEPVVGAALQAYFQEAQIPPSSLV